MINNGLSGLNRLRQGKMNSNNLERDYNKHTQEEKQIPKERISFEDTYPSSNSTPSANMHFTNGDVNYNEPSFQGEHYYNEPSTFVENDYGRSQEMEQFFKEKSAEMEGHITHKKELESVNNAEVVSTSMIGYEEKSLEKDIPVFPSVRSLIRKTSVVKEIPKIKLEVICDTFTVSLTADSIESAVNEFRKECLKGGLDDLTTSIAIDYREDLSVRSDALDCNVKSDFTLSNYTQFEDNQIITVGMAIEALFDRIGIGYLLN